MIVYFSGNGNTAHIARRLGEILGDEVIKLTADMLNNPAGKTLTLPAGDSRLVWMTPVHSWGLPPVIRRLMRSVSIAADDPAKVSHYLVATMGDDAGNLADQWRSEMKNRGWRAVSAHTVVMPETYVCFPFFNTDSPERTAEKLVRAEARTKKIAHAIKNRSDIDDVYPGPLPWVKTSVVYPIFVRTALSPKKFRAEGCIGCGKCERWCPLQNIKIERRADGTTIPVWGPDCAVCLGCYNICPVGAISRGPVSKGKGRWHLDE